VLINPGLKDINTTDLDKTTPAISRGYAATSTDKTPLITEINNLLGVSLELNTNSRSETPTTSASITASLA